MLIKEGEIDIKKNRIMLRFFFIILLILAIVEPSLNRVISEKMNSSEKIAIAFDDIYAAKNGFKINDKIGIRILNYSSKTKKVNISVKNISSKNFYYILKSRENKLIYLRAKSHGRISISSGKLSIDSMVKNG